ncbi:MAG: pyruvate kinase [Proteobacteria bacterium]|nr:pyruvate kinase [Pseudomonadota bacterium]MBU1594227.1 pyruvate kinase [Pseudomonadota bacterium]
MHTKIIATLGPASNNYETMKAMVQYGVRIFRLNFSHSDAATFLPTVKLIRQVESDLSQPVTIMGDLCGPKVRIGEITGSPVQVRKGDLLALGMPEHRDAVKDMVFVSLDMPELLKGLEVNMPVSLSDGMLQFTVTEVRKTDALYVMEAKNNGMLTSKKGIAFPGKFHPMPALTPKDRKDLHEGLDIGLDAVALSFVQTLDDIRDIRGEIERHGVWIPVVAKIERQNAVDNLESILSLTDAVMVARGDLGLECPLSAVPVIQKRITRACRHAQKAVIVATQMLLSMVNNPLPTRAEAADVANAMLDGADCVMLSEETAMGNYPVEAVKFISEIAANAEPYYIERSKGPLAPKPEKNPAKYLAYSACLLAQNCASEAIISHSASGATARYLSSRRPESPIYALTPEPRVVKHLNFFWGVEPRQVDTTLASHVQRAEKFVHDSPQFTPKQSVVITAGQPTPGQDTTHTNELKIYYK